MSICLCIPLSVWAYLGVPRQTTGNETPPTPKQPPSYLRERPVMEAGLGRGPQGKMHAPGLGGGHEPIAKARARRGMGPPKKAADAKADEELGALPVSRLVQRRMLGAGIGHDGGGWEGAQLHGGYPSHMTARTWSFHVLFRLRYYPPSGRAKAEVTVPATGRHHGAPVS